MTTLTLKAAVETAGKVSLLNGKMPGSAYAVSAKRCNVGSKLAQIKGSVCHACYALALQNLRPSVNQGWESNYMKATRMIAESPEKWAQAMAFQIRRAAEKSGEYFHRWFDSGDLASVEMLRAIVLTVEATPEFAHWLPTREAGVVKAYRKAYGNEPANLVIRISATMIGDSPLSGHGHTSTVHRHGESYVGHECPSDTPAHKALVAGKDPKRPNGWANCGACRACWDSSVENVSYPLH